MTPFTTWLIILYAILSVVCLPYVFYTVYLRVTGEYGADSDEAFQ